MSELIVEKIAPQSEILDIKGKLKLQGNLETTGTFLSSYLNVKPNDLDISTVTINDTTGYGITFLTDNKTLELNRTNPNKGIKLHTIASSKNNSYFDTLTIGNIQGGKGSITITPDSPKGSPFSNQKDKIIINTSNLLVKDPNIPVSLSKRGNETTLAKASYNAISTGSILYLGSLPKGNKSLDITNEYVSGLYTGYRSIKPGAVVVRNNFHSIGGLTHIHGKLKVGMGTAELDGTTGGYLNLHHFTGNNSLGNLDEDYEGAIIIRSGKRDLTQAAILIAIRDGDYGEDIQDEYHSVIQELSEPISWNFENAILNYQAEYDISPQNIEYTFNEPTQVVDEEFINLFETIPETELIGVPLEYMWEDMYTGATTLEEAQNQALQDKFLNTDSEFYIGVDGHSGRDSQPNIISRGSLTIGLDGRKSIVGSERNSFFEIISGINDVENHADATTLFNINNVNKKTFVQHLSSSGQLFASMSDASTNSDDQLRQHVIVVDTASGQFFITGSYGGSSTEDGKKVGFPYSGSDVVVTNNPEGSQAVITGSLFLSGSGNITASGHISSSHFYGDLTGTASYVKTASYVIGDIEGTASWALNASESVSASFASSSNSASYATNATSADTASYVQNALTKFLSLTDVDTTFNYGAIGSDFESFTPQIGAMEAAPAFGITEDTVEGQFTGLPGFIPVVNSEGTKLQLSKKVASASFADNVKNATTAFTGGKFTQGNDNSQLPNLTTEGLSDKFQMPAGFHAHGLNSTIVGNLSISGSLGVSDSITIADIQISASDGAFSFGTGSDNTITHQMTGNLSLSASTGITVNMPSNVIGFHGTASYAQTASYAINGGEGGVGFPYSGSDVVVTGNPEGSQAVITGSLFLSSSGNITASGHISSSHFYGDLTGTASYATNASESVSASYAETASYVIGTIEGTASWALNASESVSASFASSSTSASYADTASYIFGTIEGTASWALNASESVSASFASSSTSASFASSSTSASFASSSTSASFASSSTSASFASSSTSASYAKTASYIIGDVEGTASWALNASESVSASFASTSFSASYAKNVSLNFTHLTDVPSGNGENDIAAIAAVNTYPNQTHNFAVVVDGEGTALAFVKAVKSASFASGSDSASYAQNATLAETASFASNVATKFTDLKDVDSSLTEDAANPEGDTNLSGLADYVIAVEPIGNKLRAVKTVKSASFAVRSFSASFASSSTSASFALTSFSASFASSSDSASYAKTASYISSADVADLDFLDLEDTTDAYGNEGDVLVLESDTLIFKSASNSASFASSSNSASFASSSTSASFASSSTSASFASSSTSASFASSSTSASFASTSFSASYAIKSTTASYVIGDIEGTSSFAKTSSYAISGGFSESGFFAWKTLIQGDLTVSGSVGIVGGGLTINDIQVSSSQGGFTFGSGSENNINHQMTGNLQLSSSVGITANMPNNTVGFHGTASHASRSVSASYAETASYVIGTIEGTASWALNASESVSSSFASSSTSASFASSSTSASFASSSTSASFASSSTSASFASSSTSASFASSSTSASFASSSTSASYAKTASYIIGDVEGTASWALNASESVSASYASMSQEIYVNTTFGNTVAFQIGDKAEGTPTDAAPGGGTSGENLHPILFASDISKGKLNVANGNGYTDVGVTQSLRYDTYHERLLVKRFKSTLSTGTGFEGTASWADKVLSASFASSSTSASYASSSTSASFASSSTSASFASSSTSASFASSSTSASFASSSTSASFASSSTSASFASSSTSASYASQSETASYVESASFATLAISGGFSSKPFHVVNDLDVMGDIMVSGSVSIGAGLTISNVQISSSTDAFTFGTGSTNNITHQMTGNLELSASVGITANMSADTIGFHGTASWADKVLSASFASSSTSASFASSSTSASFASMSFSASFASTSFSASYAKTASYVIGDIEGTASWALNASESVSASFASSSTSASFASSSTSASFASMSFSASYASSSTSASYASSSTSASYANNTDKAERAVSASFASNSAEIFVTNYAKSALLNDNDKVHLTFVTKPDYNTTNPTITDDVPEGGVPYDAATMSKLYAFGQPAHKGLTYTPSEDLLHTTTSFALTASHALNASTNYIDLTDTEDTNYTDKSGFVPVVKENSTLPNDGVLTLLQTVPSASIAFSSSYALTASYVEGADGGNANTAETANTVLIVSEGEGFHRLIMVDQNNDFGDGEPESLQETDGLIWNGLERRLGINTFKPATELHLRGVEYIEGGTFQWTQHIPVSTPTGPNTVSVNTTLPNQIQNHPYNSGNINTNKHKPGIILPLGVGIYSIDTTNNNPTSPVNNGLLPWSNLITHREDKGVIDIGDPYSANMIDMNFYVGSRRSGNFYFNPHASTQPNLFDTTDPLGGPFSTSLNNPIPTLQIVQGKPISSNTSANTFHGSVGIRCRKGFLQDSTNALYVRGTTILGDSLVVNRMYSGNGIDTYDPKSPIPPTGVETLYNLAGPNHFEIHPPVETPSISSKFISAIRFKVDPDTMASTYQIDHQMDRSGYIIYNNATSQCDISFKTITTIPESLNPVVSGPIPTDRLHIDNLSGTVTIGATNFTNGYNWGLVGSGNVSENPPEHKKYKFVVNGPSLMNGNLIITGSSNSSGYNGKYLGYPLLKVDTMDTSDSGNFIVQFENKDITSPKILNLISHDKDARGATFISFKNIDPNGNETERGSIKSTTGGNTISYNTTSDRRLKTNIKSTNELDKLLELNPVTYNWKKGNTKDIGLIAQEVDEIYPHLVDKSNEETLQMNYIGLVPILLSGIKEQQKMIDSLEERIKKLENK